METEFKQPSYPVEVYKQTDYSDEVKKLDKGNTNMLGAVVVGGCASADCFEDCGLSNA